MNTNETTTRMYDQKEVDELLTKARKEAGLEMLERMGWLLDQSEEDEEMADDPNDPRIRIKWLRHKLATERQRLLAESSNKGKE